jgi:hypothetical protein
MLSANLSIGVSLLQHRPSVRSCLHFFPPTAGEEAIILAPASQC